MANFQPSQSQPSRFSKDSKRLALAPGDNVPVDLFGGGPKREQLIVDSNDPTVISVSSEPVASNAKDWLFTYQLKALKPGNAMLEARLFTDKPKSNAARREGWFKMPVLAFMQVYVRAAGALTIQDGKALDGRVTLKLFPNLEHGDLQTVSSLVLHQTGGGDADSTLQEYKSSTVGAHFLIAKDGTIYQTVNLEKKAFHVGKIKSKCFDMKSCSTEDQAAIKTILNAKNVGYSKKVKNLNDHESSKAYPNRYPTNDDSIGIEVASKFENETYEDPTADQNDSVKWLVAELLATYSLTTGDVYRHPDVSYKQASEAQNVKW